MYLKYLKTVLRHKWFVGQECFKVGLYWRGLVHDWSKFLPDEFLSYAKFFEGGYKYGEQPEALKAAFAAAWNEHQKRNSHHYQYHMLTWDRGDTECLPMPLKDCMEMLCDWRGAGRTYGNTDTRGWYLKNKGNIHLHPDTRRWVELHLQVEPESLA